ncbi:signal transduction histidine kinase [Actinoplanes lutulentus]|nr:histidine kinase [Actinoplanes lutulentus]MBB2948281.1 signal transduction histidine kinase [Actinoplanes lutulentus]
MEDRGTLLCAVAAVAVLVSGMIELGTEVWQFYSGTRHVLFALVVAGTALAVGVMRRLPWLALALAWLIPVCQVVTGTPLVITQAAVVMIAFGLARWGSPVILWLSALSILAGAVTAMVLLGFDALRITIPSASWYLIAGTVNELGIGWQIGTFLLLGALLGMPWLAGFALRISDRARTDLARAARERAQAEETARIRDAQTRLARDVHDVVGHSLAVILAQAESGQYLADDDPAALKSALATIATSARTSLRDVREVLTTTRDSADDLDQLIGNLRDSGHEVLSSQEGMPLPLDEARRTTAYRVLQEMLTNAIRHGLRGGALIVRRNWADDAFEVEVRNAVSPGTAESSPGSGLDGMRERLVAVGGTLSASRNGDVFVATARIPLS